MYDSLMFIPENNQNKEGYIDAKRFGYRSDTQELDFLGNTDVMPWKLNYTENYRMDFIPGGINLFRRDRQKFKASSFYYSDTTII